MLVTFLKRLFGADAEALEAAQLFRSGLHGVDAYQQELVVAGAVISEIIRAVERKQEQINQNSAASSGVSGAYALSLPPSVRPGDKHE